MNPPVGEGEKTKFVVSFRQVDFHATITLRFIVQRARATGNLHFAPWDAMSKALWERSESKIVFFFFSLVSPSTSSAWWCALSDACIRVFVSRVCCCIVLMLLLAANVFPTAKRREKTVNYGDNLNVIYYDHEWTDLYIKVSGLAKK